MSLWDRLRIGRQTDMAAEDAAPEGAEAADETQVAGERSESAVQRPPSLQSRLTNLLAAGLLGTLTLGLLGWYCVTTVSSRANARETAQATSKDKAKGELALRPLGRVDPPAPAPVSMESLLGEAPEEPPPEDIPEAWLRPAEESPPTTGAPRRPAGKSPEELQQERKLAGHAFSAPGGDMRAPAATLEEQNHEGMQGLLQTSSTPAASAHVLPTQQLLLPKGAFLDCTLETAIDSSLPGMTTCVLATDAFSADGSVVLLERGTKLVGETKGQARAGSVRVFVLWNEARTPKGVVVPLASPGTDEIGRSGLPGQVNRHFFERFGAAILLSVIDGVVLSMAQSSGADGDTVVVSPNTSSQVMTEVLKSTLSIPPTVVKPQGDRIQVFVARDLDFRSVYSLRPASGRH